MRNQHENVRVNLYAWLTIIVLLLAIPAGIFLFTKKPDTTYTEKMNHQAAFELSMKSEVNLQSGTGKLIEQVNKVRDVIQKDDFYQELSTLFKKGKQLIQEKEINETNKKMLQNLLDKEKEIKSLTLEQLTDLVKEMKKVLEETEKQITEMKNRNVLFQETKELLQKALQLVENKEISEQDKGQLTTLIAQADKHLKNLEIEIKELETFNASFGEAINRTIKAIEETLRKSEEALKTAKNDAKWFNGLTFDEKEQVYSRRTANQNEAYFGDYGLVLAMSDKTYLIALNNNQELYELFVTAKVDYAFRSVEEAEKAGYTNITKASNSQDILKKAHQKYEEQTKEEDTSSSE